jgi:thiol-disulfide isomerase/thioredoxin
MTTRLLAGAVAIACLLVLSGCAGLEGTGDKGYITGAGEITQVAPAERGEPVELTGEDLDGDRMSLTELRGEVAVVNVWWSACPPCRTEMPHLVDAAEETSKDAAFVGINIRDSSVDQAKAFVRTFDVPWPSFYDPSGEALLPFAGRLSPRSIPSTVVLDRDGRIAATVIGAIPSEQTLVDIVEQVASEA